MKITVEPNTLRRARLVELAGDREVYSDAAKAALKSGPVPRYAMLVTEGTSQSSYADNPDLTVHDTIEALAAAAAEQIAEDWTPKRMVDLDTGEDLDWTVKVEVTP